mmetsp:Transcript_12086/g.25514  ORF Transcript_12086/g.25514 Transcript_12086/m.25514 type:complete len:216 (-) Transcript_12086:314-961(-)
MRSSQQLHEARSPLPLPAAPQPRSPRPPQHPLATRPTRQPPILLPLLPLRRPGHRRRSHRRRHRLRRRHSHLSRRRRKPEAKATLRGPPRTRRLLLRNLLTLHQTPLGRHQIPRLSLRRPLVPQPPHLPRHHPRILLFRIQNGVSLPSRTEVHVGNATAFDQLDTHRVSLHGMAHLAPAIRTLAFLLFSRPRTTGVQILRWTVGLFLSFELRIGE